jgi:hypothetical protein
MSAIACVAVGNSSASSARTVTASMMPSTEWTITKAAPLLDRQANIDNIRTGVSFASGISNSNAVARSSDRARRSER